MPRGRIGSAHWRSTLDADGIAWLTLDQAPRQLRQLAVARSHGGARRAASPSSSGRRRAALVDRVREASGFIAGADIKEFVAVRTPEQALPLRCAAARRCSTARAHCPARRSPRSTAIALGGGLELALACATACCVDDPKTTLGLPEVQLGIHPGFGGTVRAVRLIGVTAAMDLMLTDATIRPDKALALGLVDRLVPARRTATPRPARWRSTRRQRASAPLRAAAV